MFLEAVTEPVESANQLRDVLILAATVVGTGVGTAMVTMRSGRNRSAEIDTVAGEARVAAGQARLAAVRSEPTSNGFARTMLEGMTYLRGRVDTLVDQHGEVVTALARMDERLTVVETKKR